MKKKKVKRASSLIRILIDVCFPVIRKLENFLINLNL